MSHGNEAFHPLVWVLSFPSLPLISLCNLFKPDRGTERFAETIIPANRLDSISVRATDDSFKRKKKMFLAVASRHNRVEFYCKYNSRFLDQTPRGKFVGRLLWYLTRSVGTTIRFTANIKFAEYVARSLIRTNLASSLFLVSVLAKWLTLIKFVALRTQCPTSEGYCIH